MCFFLCNGGLQEERLIGRLDRDCEWKKEARLSTMFASEYVFWIKKNTIMLAACTATDMSTNQNYNVMSARCKSYLGSVIVLVKEGQLMILWPFSPTDPSGLEPYCLTATGKIGQLPWKCTVTLAMFVCVDSRRNCQPPHLPACSA